MKSHYTVAEFSALAGVTVKALHHYDRHGLLRPGRSGAGYRLYVARDLERLEQIVALKAIGLTLDQIRTLLDGDAHALAAALCAQRQTLERRCAELTRAIHAIQQVETKVDWYRALSRGGVLTRLIEAIDMQNALDLMQRYFKTNASWARGRRFFEEWPSPSWRELFRDVQAARGADPASDHARALAARWDTLFRSDTNGDFAFRAGLWRAWYDFESWPDSLKQPVAEFDFMALWKFIAEVAWAEVGPDGRLPNTDPTRAPDRVSATKISLFREIASSLDDDTDSRRTAELIAKWRALVDEEAGGDAQTKAALSKAWTNHREWPSGYQRFVASLFDTTVETWTRVADVLAQQRVECDHLPT